MYPHSLLDAPPWLRSNRYEEQRRLVDMRVLALRDDLTNGISGSQVTFSRPGTPDSATRWDDAAEYIPPDTWGFWLTLVIDSHGQRPSRTPVTARITSDGVTLRFADEFLCFAAAIGILPLLGISRTQPGTIN